MSSRFGLKEKIFVRCTLPYINFDFYSKVCYVLYVERDGVVFCRNFYEITLQREKNFQIFFNFENIFHGGSKIKYFVI